jgi:hypothetical protein
METRYHEFAVSARHRTLAPSSHPPACIRGSSRLPKTTLSRKIGTVNQLNQIIAGLAMFCPLLVEGQDLSIPVVFPEDGGVVDVRNFGAFPDDGWMIPRLFSLRWTLILTEIGSFIFLRVIIRSVTR